MKIKNIKILYAMSLLLLATSVYLYLEFNNSNRMQLIAGFIGAIGFISNILYYSLTQLNKSK